MAQVSNHLKEALFEALKSILSGNHEVRTTAEEQLKILEVTDDYGVHLSELAIDKNATLSIRQLACVLLKQYVSVHWVHGDDFREPLTNEYAKSMIKQLLPLGLNESISKIRAAIAYAISAIAASDWPDEWPQLFDILMVYITSEDINAVHGAMRVLNEISFDIAQRNMENNANIIIPQMYRIFLNYERYSIRTRSRALLIFSSYCEEVMNASDRNNKLKSKIIYPILDTFTEALVSGLNVSDGRHSDCGLKKDILACLTLFVKNIPKKMEPYLPQILTHVWNLLTNSAEHYSKTVINNIEEADEAVDSDGEVLGFENLIYNIFDFVLVIAETPATKEHIKKGLSELVYYIMLFMQITNEQMLSWTSDVNNFIEDDEEESYCFTVRISAQDLVLLIVDEFEDEWFEAVIYSLERHMQEANHLKNTGNETWWKIHEMCFFTLGILQSSIDIHKSERFDIRVFIENVVLPDLNLSNAPIFLSCRCLWLASKYCVKLKPQLCQRFLETTLSGLQIEQAPCVQVSAIKSINGFCSLFNNQEYAPMFAPYLPEIVDKLTTLCYKFDPNMFNLIIEAIENYLSIDQNFTAMQEAKISPIILNVLIKHNIDVLVVAHIKNVITLFAKSHSCETSLHQRIVPVLLSILQYPPNSTVASVQAVAFEILQNLIWFASKPLSQPFINQVFPIAVHCILNSDDVSCIQNGGEAMRAYTCTAMDQLINWHDDSRCNGVTYLIKVIFHILDPKAQDDRASQVGNLIGQLFKFAGHHLAENTESILRAILSKLQNSDHCVSQSLMYVFAQLVHYQLEAMLEFLSGVPGPLGESALQFVLTEWCTKQACFYDVQQNKVFTLALCKLLEYGVNSNDRRLVEMTVPGDEIFDSSAGVKTRSKSAQNPGQWTTIPVLIKIYKCIIAELKALLEIEMALMGDGDDYDEEDEEDEETEYEVDQSSASSKINLSHILQQASDSSDIFEDMDLFEHPDFKCDPNVRPKLRSYLVQFLRSFSQQPYYETFSQHLSLTEKQFLNQIDISS